MGAAIDRCARALRRARVHFGHGTDNARDEAAELVFYAAGMAHSLGSNAYSKRLTVRRAARIDELLERRIAERIPLPYLTHRAFFAGLELYVDERVLVPRSPIAELILQRFQPWTDALRVRRILDVGTGSGAIAVAAAMAFPKAVVDAVDVSAAALQVARRNVRRLNLGKRVRMLQSDHFDAVEGRRYDIIVSNPPYVGRAEMRRLPRSIGTNPGWALPPAPTAWIRCGRYSRRRGGISAVMASWPWKSAIPSARCCARFQGCRLSGPRLRWAAVAYSCFKHGIWRIRTWRATHSDESSR